MGFKQDVSGIYMGMEKIPPIITKATLHDLSADIAFKIKPFAWQLRPYLTAGLRGDYRMSYKDNTLFNPDHFNKFTLSGLLGAGLEYKELVYLDFEYDPGISAIFKDNNSIGRDRYFGVSVGMNISTLIRKNKKSVD